ncbi:hypothetical protein CSB45_08005 [candidate division KSB3 bacterium]|uniref:histidine kinase n=1 Tax=candidate division KSB3 bacterium TaxID=2044937 RepID=A0A2G6E510_9BACT|nr:MAG: hypothetical protein CSB45_08005 [candidate division KSB3 bacterium]PIE29835.1 MAG: hypothetical protein CSA57_07215 [candidate division KSB3 bacterium]
MKILIADDSATIIQVVRFLLEAHGYEVIAASDGIEAIIKACETRPDLILLDIEMPKMNGYQVCRLLKSDDSTRDIPIIILTSRGQRKDRFWGLSTGADDFMTKDFEKEEELLHKIETLCRTKPQSRQEPLVQAGRPVGSPGGRAPITEVSLLERVNHILDRQLFQATIVNELSSIAINMHSFFTTIHTLFTLLSKVCEFQTASIFMKEEKVYHHFLYVVPPLSSYLDKVVQQRIIESYQKYQPLEVVKNIDLTILEDKNQRSEKHERPQEEEQATFCAFPLKVRNSVIGVLGLGSAKENVLSSETIETLKVFTNEASIVLDNALLFKQLEQSNRELEDTIEKLTSTQSQLVQSEKMASLGQLVAGVAHEINTPAGAINAATSNLLNVLSSIVEHFRQFSQVGMLPEEKEVTLSVISRFLNATNTPRKSTALLREEARALEQHLKHEGITNVRRIAKLLARFDLDQETLDSVILLLKRYTTANLLNFWESCYKIINASRDIKTSIRVITKIVNALKLYSRLDQARIEEADIHEGLETTLTILQNQMKYGIEVERRFGELPKISCYSNELNQVWTNIIHNAVQAMEGVGKLTIETVYIPRACGTEASETSTSAPDTTERIMVRITDTGPGIPPEIQAKIFDPYFTTKDQGQGSGLGLGIALQIIERHHGVIQVKSRKGETVFEVVLPVSGVQEEYLEL